MLVRDFMTKNVITAQVEEKVSNAITKMKENNIKHLPIIDKDKIFGIISIKEIEEYSPSKATSLDIFELHYLLSKITLKEIARRDVITITPDIPIEEAGAIMYKNRIGSLPVLENDKLVGIISDRDIFKLLISITAAQSKGVRIYTQISDAAGTIAEIVNIISKFDTKVHAIFTCYEKAPAGKRNVVIRTTDIANINGLEKELKEKYDSVLIQKF
ncbi:CBS domain protein [Desulfurella amilsii]|uniref:CBS domain protein n=1 Tax=Desulfurella amilsii TaxID=1562698 RepID=A0A1X4XZL8_9BACT|nr:CBS and ACT domain-containing protein [Desulfurella amilsii]OSS42987.1 CBS domain protein [Desulfurella amilsii]